MDIYRTCIPLARVLRRFGPRKRSGSSRKRMRGGHGDTEPRGAPHRPQWIHPLLSLHGSSWQPGARRQRCVLLWFSLAETPTTHTRARAQMAHLLGSVYFAKLNNRTLVVPPFIEYHVTPRFIPYEQHFDIRCVLCACELVRACACVCVCVCMCVSPSVNLNVNAIVMHGRGCLLAFCLSMFLSLACFCQSSQTQNLRPPSTNNKGKWNPFLMRSGSWPRCTAP